MFMHIIYVQKELIISLLNRVYADFWTGILKCLKIMGFLIGI